MFDARVWKGRVQERVAREIRSIWRFGLVGIAATVVHACVALGLVQFLDVAAFTANIVGFLVAFVVSFVGHHVWSFPGGDGRARSRMIRFFAIALAGFLINSSALAAWLRWIHLPAELGILVSIALVPIVTFLGARFWAFSATGHHGIQRKY